MSNNARIKISYEEYNKLVNKEIQRSIRHAERAQLYYDLDDHAKSAYFQSLEIRSDDRQWELSKVYEIVYE